MGSVAVIGEFEGPIAFDAPHASNGKEDLFLVKLDLDTGKYLWSETWGGLERDGGGQVAIGPNGVITTSQVTTDAVPPVTLGPLTLRGRDIWDGNFLISFESMTGAPQWGRPLGIGDGVSAVVALPDGETVLSGYFHHTFNFDTGPIKATSGDFETRDALVARYGH